MYTIVFVPHLYNLIIIRVSSENQRGDVRGEVSRVGRDRLPAPRLTFLMVPMITVVIVIIIMIIFAQTLWMLSSCSNRT